MARSYPKMELAALAADRAQRNLDVVRDKYARGAVSILELLDAQNQSRVQEQSAVLAVYSYLGDVLDFQRAVGWFEIDKTPAERREFLSRFGVGTKE
jgi:outer membrane protein TolC